jgi:hypothetical protein
MRHSKRSTLAVTFLCMLAIAMMGASPAASKAPVPRGQIKADPASEFQDAMRKLWEDHITWTRLFIVSAAADLPDKQATTERLMQNQVDIGDAVKPYYGSEAGEKLTGLLKDHITIAAELVTAAKAGNAAQVEDANRRWLVNADAIAQFLSGANPSAWPSGEMKQMMHDHLSLTTAEVQDRLKGNYAADIADYEKVHVQILRMADMLSDGIIHQFPKKF